MGYKSVRLSDISGIELNDNEIVTVVVKSAGKVFDCTVDELKPLKAVSSVVELEIRYPNGDSATQLVQKADFAKLVPDDKLAGFDSSRGRRSGFSPSKTNGAHV